MQKKYLILIQVFLTLLIFNSCRYDKWTPSRNFRMTVQITNPVKSLQMVVGLRLHPLHPDCAQLFLHRPGGPYTEPVYYSPGTVRRFLADTFCLTRSEWNRLITLIGESKSEEMTIEEPFVEENLYDITIEDSAWNIRLRAFENSPALSGRLSQATWELVNKYFPEYPVLQYDAKIIMIRTTESGNDTFKIQKNKNVILWQKNQYRRDLNELHYLQLWTTFESYGIWSLKSDTTHITFFPVYQIQVQLGSQETVWKVKAPHLLKNKNYDGIIHAVESFQE